MLSGYASQMPYEFLCISRLDSVCSLSTGLMTDELSAFLETNLPTAGKMRGVMLGVTDAKLAAVVNEKLSIPVTHIGVVPEVRCV